MGLPIPADMPAKGRPRGSEHPCAVCGSLLRGNREICTHCGMIYSGWRRIVLEEWGIELSEFEWITIRKLGKDIAQPNVLGKPIDGKWLLNSMWKHLILSAKETLDG